MFVLSRFINLNSFYLNMRKEKIKEKMEKGKKEADVYSDDGVEELTEEEDEVEDTEEGFMEGYNVGGERFVKCKNCGEIIGEDFVEEEINEEMYRFCSDECAEKYIRKVKKSRK